MNKGIAGSARVEGVGRTSGVPRGAGYSAGGTQITVDGSNAAVKRAMLFWAVAVGVLLVMHVGGSTFSE